MKKIIQIILKQLARMILSRYKPDIIGITGSIGKTSAKEAIYTVLRKKFKVRTNIKNYNNEIGLPLTIIGCESGGKSILNWVKVVVRALNLWLILNKNYPNILILEMGVDRPDDMKYLLEIIQPQVGVITYIGEAHIEFFGSVENIKKEKALLVSQLPRNGWAVINIDNDKAKEIGDASKAKVLTYGFSGKAMVKAVEISLSYIDAEGNRDLKGVSFKLGHNGSYVPIILNDVIGVPAVYAALAGASLGIIYKMNLVEISEALKNFQAPNGRLNIIPGLNRATIIDDTYNSSPAAVMAALDLVEQMENNKNKWVILGDMLELGVHSKDAHEIISRKVISAGVNKLVTIGSKSIEIADSAKKLRFNPDNIFSFLDSASAAKFLKEKIGAGDLIMVKGSQGMRMERIVKAIMAEPEKAKDLLVRQEEEWEDR